MVEMRNSPPILVATLSGIAAFAASFLAVLVPTEAIHFAYYSTFDGTPVPVESLGHRLEFAGDLFFNAHLTTIPPGGNALFEAGGVYQLLVAVPPVALVAAGLVTSYYSAGRGGFVQGVKPVLLYPPLVAAITIPGAVHLNSLFFPLFVVGFLYPVVFGGIGGLIGGELQHRRRGDGDRSGVTDPVR